MKTTYNIWLKVNKLAFWLLDFILPQSASAKRIEKMTAEEFWEQAKPCELPLAKENKAIFSYKDKLVKDTIWLLKYRKDWRSAKIFGEILGSVATEWLEDLRTFENFENPLLVPVPMGKNRRATRGKNHTETLCEKMLISMPEGFLTYEPKAMEKIKETQSQARTKNRDERLKNLSESFSANQKIVRGKNILLIDDVITTGATIDECRKTLLSGGAKKVYALAIAH